MGLGFSEIGWVPKIPEEGMDHQGSQDDFWGSLMGRTTSEGQQIAELKGEVLKLKNKVAEQQKVMKNLTDCIQTLTVEISNLVTTVNGTKEARKQRRGPSKPASRAFSDFEVPLSTLLGRLVTKGILRPLKPVPPPNPLPRGYKAFRYCEFSPGGRP